MRKSFIIVAMNFKDHRALPIAGMETGQSFLDLGCGDGRLAALAMRKYVRVNGGVASWIHGI